MEGLKVVHVCTSDAGGAAAACIRLHEALLGIGVRSKLLTLSRKKQVNAHEVYRQPEPLSFLKRVSVRFGISRLPHIERSEKLRGKITGYEHFSFTETDYDILKAPAVADADIIHLHWVAGYLDYSSFFSRCTKPVVWTMHDVNTFTGGCHYPSGCELFRSSCEVCPQLAGTPDPAYSNVQWEEKKKCYSKFSMHLVGPSIWMAKLAASSSLCKDFPVTVIPYSLDLEVFKPADKMGARKELGLPPDKKILLFVSSSIDNRRKGFGLLLEAVSTLAEDILVCGVGRNDSSPVKGVTFLGEISDQKKMSAAYAACDAFILPALEDNLPNVVLEALACGRPVLGFRIGGMPDMVEEGVNGMLVDEISATSLRDLIMNWSKQYNMFSAEKIRNKAESQYSHSKQAAAYMQVYNTLLSK